MIQINLSPNRLNKNLSGGVLSSIELPREILIGLGGLCLTVLIALHLLLMGGYVIQLTQQIIYKITWQKMLPEKKNIDSIGQEIKDLRAKITTINEITSKKAIVWSQKLNSLSDQLPKGLWLKSILWDSKIMVIEGSAYSKQHDEINIVGSFAANLKKDEGFARDFRRLSLIP